MNIKYHALIGVIGEVAMPSKGLFFIASLIPDIVLIPNEINLLRSRSKFDETKISIYVLNLYYLTHSLPFVLLCFVLNQTIGYAILVHQICDWFTHTGLFATKPFFPFSKISIKFGRNILK